MQGLIGKKLGMTRVFDENGAQVPVTAILCGPCVVLRRRTLARDGYEAVQVGFEQRSERGLRKSELGLFKKAGAAPMRWSHEFAVDAAETLKEGDVVTVGMFEPGAFVDVSGLTKGKGFQGVVRRHNMGGGSMTHGGKSKRRIGAIGCRELPGHIHKGKRMPGHMGAVNVTQQNLKVVKVMPDDNLLLLRGSVPGCAGGMVLVKKAVKKAAKQ